MNSAAKITAANLSRRTLKDKLFKGLVLFLSLITISPIVLIIYKLVEKGYRQISLNFIIKTPPNTFEAMTAVSNGELIPGGIANGITGTLLMVVLASVISIPVGVITGIYLYENPGKPLANLTRNISDILQGVPSIVLGLIAYMWIVKPITSGFSALAGSVSLSIMMLPMIVRSTEETLKMIPQSIKEAAVALGVPYYKVILRVLIPTGFSGLLTGILLGISRILGETAPLMLTALGSSVINLDITKPTSAIPLLIWEFYNDPNMVDLIWSSSLLLMGMVLTLNLVSKRIAARTK
ncbi:phosphate ABC transporter membrane protein 2, PhoT family [Draconibacterium orientale]|uniref:Phosphate transport system permease protein PstA n=1 Tax=Draconibacterium orientale TaxID=1168034 RepID=X5DFM7_9BACT|nr:phosphate ABC transporter permease PstA [Draconibacterium orientale]AHW59849.1 phosphate ABC transporter permease [Draconibacterium orientale]SET76602.1 phosphate ABC transporter membrane protein 2, PhoT family [Draconibacterium orientale]